ncbi:TspO/MBR family protein [Patescibacteria group bacterium]
MNYKRLAICLALPQAAGIIGSLFTNPGTSAWYQGLVKPWFNPPGWIFGPVWVSLYVLMGLSAYLIWQQTKKNKMAFKYLNIFWIHLFFNALWSILFFGLESPGLALANILIIWSLILILMIDFWKIKSISTYLLIPYFVWVSFATILNYYIWILN